MGLIVTGGRSMAQNQEGGDTWRGTQTGARIQAIQRGASMEWEGKPGLGSPRGSRVTSPLLEGHLGFSGGHLRHSHPPQGLAIPREA